MGNEFEGIKRSALELYRKRLEGGISEADLVEGMSAIRRHLGDELFAFRYGKGRERLLINDVRQLRSPGMKKTAEMLVRLKAQERSDARLAAGRGAKFKLKR